MVRAASLGVVVTCGAAWAQPLAVPALTADETKRLEARKLVLLHRTPTDGKGVALRSMFLVDAPSTEVWPVLRDCQHFDAFMPRVKSSALNEEDGASVCHVEIRMPFPLKDLWSDAKSVIQEGPVGHFSRAWTLVRGTYHRNSGSWTVHPWGDGSRSLVVYVIDSDPALAIPDAIIRSTQAGQLSEMFEAIRTRVVRLRAGR